MLKGYEYFLLRKFSKWKPVIFLFPAFYECYLNSKFKIIVFDKISFLALHEASQKLIRLTCVSISFLFCHWSLHILLYFRATRNIKIAFLDTTIMLKNVLLSYVQKFECKFSKLSWYHYLDQVISNPVLFKSAKMKALIEYRKS